MTETKRIRWHDEPDGLAASTGYVGTLDPLVFQIWRPDTFSAEWTLTARLPGDGDKAVCGAGPDELRAEAERWLERFVASLGAVFGAPDYSAVTRFETIDHTRGLASISLDSTRAVVVYGARVEFSLQDDGRTLKVILTDPAKETAVTAAREEDR
jgi:hypothetical protein